MQIAKALLGFAALQASGRAMKRTTQDIDVTVLADAPTSKILSALRK